MAIDNRTAFETGLPLGWLSGFEDTVNLNKTDSKASRMVSSLKEVGLEYEMLK